MADAFTDGDSAGHSPGKGVLATVGIRSKHQLPCLNGSPIHKDLGIGEEVAARHYFRKATGAFAALLVSAAAIITLSSAPAYASSCNTAATGSWSNNCSVSEGSYSYYVAAVQNAVNSWAGTCGELNVDGDFGSLTLAGVKCYQSHEGLVADGVVGPETWSAIQSGLPYLGTSNGWAYYSASGACTGSSSCNEYRKWVSSGRWYIHWSYYSNNAWVSEWVRLDMSTPL